MNMLARAALALSALFACAPAMADATSSKAPAGYAPQVAPVTVAASSTPLAMSISSAGGSITSGATQVDATGTSHTASCSGTTTTVCGPFYPQLNREITLQISGTFTYSALSAGVTLDGNCAHAQPRLMTNQIISAVTFPGDLTIDDETRATAGWCLTMAVPSGTAAPQISQ